MLSIDENLYCGFYCMQWNIIYYYFPNHYEYYPDIHFTMKTNCEINNFIFYPYRTWMNFVKLKIILLGKTLEHP